MRKSNKQNLPTSASGQKQIIFPYNKKKCQKPKTQFCKSAQQLITMKTHVPCAPNNISEQRFTNILGTSTKHNEQYQTVDENQHPYLREREDQKAFNNLKSSIDSFNGISTIQMLKRQAELLEMQENLGTIRRLSTIESGECAPQKNIVLQVNRLKKSNPRKIAKGRPQLYNWIRNYKRQMVQLNMQQYKSQIMRKTLIHKAERKQIKQSKQLNIQKQKFKSQSNQSSHQTRKMTFIEKLKKLEDLKQRGKSFQLINQRRIQSQNCEQNYQTGILKTLA